MKITHKGLITLIDNLQYFGDKRLPQKVSYAITKNLLGLTNYYSCYEGELEKIIAHYDQHIKKDNDGNIVYGNDGIPLIENAEIAKAMKDEIQGLLDFEIEVEMYEIDQELLDYDDERYDPLTLNELLALSSTMVKQKE